MQHGAWYIVDPQLKGSSYPTTTHPTSLWLALNHRALKGTVLCGQ